MPDLAAIDAVADDNPAKRFEPVVNKFPVALAWTDGGEVIDSDTDFVGIKGQWALIDLREEHKVAAVMDVAGLKSFLSVDVQGKEPDKESGERTNSYLVAFTSVSTSQMNKKCRIVLCRTVLLRRVALMVACIGPMHRH